MIPVTKDAQDVDAGEIKFQTPNPSVVASAAP